MGNSDKLLITSIVCLTLMASCVQPTHQVYLDNVGRFSSAMTKFIDNLLGKIRYLADVAIENSLYENCQPVCLKEHYNIYNPVNKSSLEQVTTNQQGPNLWTKKSEKCAIFGIEVQADDLPSPEMLTCCKELHQCYNVCDKTKLACDVQFQGCLNNLCKERFQESMDKYLTCDLSSKVLIIGNLAFGCKEYKQQQSASCCKDSRYHNTTYIG